MSEENQTEEVEVKSDELAEINKENFGVAKNISDDPMELAATMLYMYTPKFQQAVGKLSSNALRRILNKLVSYPLNDKAYKATSQLEQDAFNVGDRLLEAKFLMITSTYSDIIQNEMKKEQESNKAE